MQILVNHLTRMQAPRICIAGIDQESSRHIRPVTGPTNPLTRELLASLGGPVEVAAVLELGKVVAQPSPPETEDYRFRPSKAKFIERLDGDAYLDAVDEVCEDDLESIFGSALIRRRWNYAVDPGTGETSLGVLRVKTTADLAVNKYGALKLRLNDPEKPAFLPVNDLRFYRADHRKFRSSVIENVRSRIRTGVPLRLMVGLARAWPAPGDDRPRHWLQVNGVSRLPHEVGGFRGLAR